jgi:cysteine sulfinate desulfinase/cysteine desulfurase-like protein
VQPDGRSYEYRLSDVPMHQELLRTGMRFSFGRFFTDQDIDDTAAACRKVLTHFARS